ncbi:hypothetical protein GGI07_003535 [Coemansia sp. Benny D115]|nr:hypothetical protein GGI07_003535 [Coemansia sp. Benny D115]
MANDTRGLAAVHSAATRYAHIVIKEPSTAEPKKAKRKRITPEQLKELTAVFACTDTPTHDVREELSKKLEMTNREVQVWFQNRRAKYNRLRIEQQRQIRNNTAIVYGAAMAAAAPQTHIAQPIYVYTEPVQPSEPRNQSQAQTQIQAPAPVSHEANSHSRLATRRNTLSSYPNLPLQTNMAPTLAKFSDKRTFWQRVFYICLGININANVNADSFGIRVGVTTATLLADTGRYSHLQAATRVRSYTSPPDTQAESDHRPESPTQCQDLLMTEAKMGIDVLAAAAVSVSSAKSSTALMLPHLTPLAEFSMRTQAPSHQIDSSVPTSPHQPRESSPASRPEAERSTPSWRPW